MPKRFLALRAGRDTITLELPRPGLICQYSKHWDPSRYTLSGGVEEQPRDVLWGEEKYALPAFYT